ncbi:MAG: hypothetical protein ACFFD2_11200 [Promethearchaeota archaeon]
MFTKYVLPFIGGNHPFIQEDLEAIEVAAVLMDVEYEKKKKEKFIGIYKTYLPLWVISIDEINGIMVEALILNSEYFRTRRFDKATELDPQRDLTSGSISDFISKLRLFESKINTYQKETKFELNGYLNPEISSDIRVLFKTVERKAVSDIAIMSQRLSEQAAILMCEPIISIFHVNVRRILESLYQIPKIVNNQLLQLYNELSEVANQFGNKVQELERNIDMLDDGTSYKKQYRMAETLTTELTSFRDAKNRSVKKLQSQWEQINYLNDKIQQGYLNLISSVFETKEKILKLGTPFSEASQRSKAVSVLMPIYIALFQEKKNRIAYLTPYILNFERKKELTHSKGFDTLKNHFKHHYSKKLPPGILEIDEYNLLLSPNTQQIFNDGVHKLRETKIISSKTYVRIMDAYNEFFRQARLPPKSRF